MPGKKLQIIIIITVIVVVLALALAGTLGYVFFAKKVFQETPVPERPKSSPEVTKPEEGREGIRVELPNGGKDLSSPVEIIGSVSGDGWIAFEAQTGTVELLDANGMRLAFGLLIASIEDWMTLPVPFKTTLVFDPPATETGTLVFRNENPSGEPERDRELRIPVTFARSGETVVVKVFFGSSSAGFAGECENVLPVERRIPRTQAVGRAALSELLKGPTADEMAQGYFTSINPGVELRSLAISGGTARADFSPELEQAVGGSCRVAAIRSQIINTLLQFPTVERVVISIDGRTEDILQP